VIVARTRNALDQALTDLRARGETLALVPTMGYLHEGHLSLVDRALEHADAAAVSIFVNPLQFGPSEDLERYPRDEPRDLALLEERGAAIAFVPEEGEMYPDGEPRVTVAPGPMELRLCGLFRPGHFRGVLTVVAKLFGLFRPDVAVFGRKDFQQGVLIQRMVRDLEMGIRIELGEIVREPDGLAMSSRNAYLGPEERAQARVLHDALFSAARLHAGGERRAEALLDEIRRQVGRRELLELQYVDAVDPATLDPVRTVDDDTVVALAAFCGTTRLIDNVRLGDGPR
jgi:pantoate--beta-alanine ligase